MWLVWGLIVLLIVMRIARLRWVECSSVLRLVGQWLAVACRKWGVEMRPATGHTVTSSCFSRSRYEKPEREESADGQAAEATQRGRLCIVPSRRFSLICQAPCTHMFGSK